MQSISQISANVNMIFSFFCENFLEVFMDVELTVERIKALSKTKGFKMKFICGNIGARDNYFTIGRIFEPYIVWGNGIRSNQKDTPYHNGRECPFLFFV